MAETHDQDGKHRVAFDLAIRIQGTRSLTPGETLQAYAAALGAVQGLPTEAFLAKLPDKLKQL